MEPLRRRRSPLGWLVGHLRTTLGAGLLVILPIAVTVLVLKFVFDLLDPWWRPLWRWLGVPEVPGLGLVALLVLVYLVGLVAAYLIGPRLIKLVQRGMESVPVVRGIYATYRAAVQVLAGSKDHPYRGVVLLDLGGGGPKSIGLITAHLGELNGQEMVAVFIPNTPIPTSGALVVVPAKDLVPTDISVDDAMKIIISAGVLGQNAFNSPSRASPDPPAT